jgi:hypothetical protein
MGLPSWARRDAAQVIPFLLGCNGRRDDGLWRVSLNCHEMGTT